MYQVEIMQWQQPLPVLMRPHQGSYAGIGSAFSDLRNLLQQHADGPQSVQAYGQYLDDPAKVGAEQLRSAACLAPPPVLSLSPTQLEQMGFVYGELAAGRYACIVHQGPYQQLAAAWDWLLRVWLPASDEQFGQRPLLDEALCGPHDVASALWRTRLLLPLA